MTPGGCWHCGEPLPRGDAPKDTISATIDGAVRRFCCPGCRAAAQWIAQIGLGDYYRLRSAPAQRPAEASDERAAWARDELARHVVRERSDGAREAMLLIDGIRCSACVWLIERMLGALPGVLQVSVNAAAQRARIASL